MATTAEMTTAEAERHFSQRRGLIELWIGVLAAPIAWLLHLQVNYTMIGTFLCASGWEFLLHVVTGVMLLIAVSGMWIAWRSWRRMGLGWPRGEGGVIGRSRFMAAGGFFLGVLFSLMIVAGEIPNHILNACLV